jgi:class 3 adenylate cyclase
VDNPHRDCAFSDDDLRLLLAIARHAALSLSNRQLQDELRENSFAMERLLPDFSSKLRARLIDDTRQGRIRTGGAKSSLTILHAEIRCVTASGRNNDSSAAFEILNQCFTPLTEAILSFDGTLHQFTGEGMVAVFGSPEPDLVQHSKAVRAAWAMQRAIREVNALRAANGQMICELGIGLRCGEVIHGFVGSPERFGFTVIGDAVHAAAQLAKSAGAGEILVDDELYQRTSALTQVEKVSLPASAPGSAVIYRIKGLNS